MALRTRGIIVQIAKETTFNTAPTFTDDDVVQTEKATISPKVDKVDRKVLACSLIKEAGIPVRFTSSGDISFEMDVKDSGDDLFGAVLFEAGLGYKNAADGNNGNGGFIGYEGDGTTVADKVSKANSDAAGTATIYTVAETDRISVAIKKFYDSGDVVLQTTGNVISKASFNFAQADIITANFSVEGCNYAELTGQTKPACAGTSNLPFVGKNATFKFGGVSTNAKNITVDITNSVYNEEAITSEGYTDKIITEKEISGSFVVLLENFDYLDKLTNQTIGELYLRIDNGTKQMGLYLPRVKVSDVNISDDSGNIIEVTVNYQAEKDSTVGEALILGIKS